MKVVVVLGDASSSDRWPVDTVEVCVEEWSRALESKRRRESGNHHQPNPQGEEFPEEGEFQTNHCSSELIVRIYHDIVV
jgi:hypothetical protein